MEIIGTKLPDVWLIKPDVNTDFRGDYVTKWNEKQYRDIMAGRGVPQPFVEHDISTSTKGVLRGIHYSPHCWKLNQCLYGKLYYVVVNCDPTHPGFGKWQSFILSGENH